MKAKNTNYIGYTRVRAYKALPQQPPLAGLPMGDGFPMGVPFGIERSVGSSDFAFLAYGY